MTKEEKILSELNEQQQVAVSESYIDEAVDYAMLDNADIYQLLAEE